MNFSLQELPMQYLCAHNFSNSENLNKFVNRTIKRGVNNLPDMSY